MEKEMTGELITRDLSTIRYYEGLYRQGRKLAAGEYNKIICGEAKMNATNKCLLPGYHFRERFE